MLVEESFVYGNFVVICECIGLVCDFVSQCLIVMKVMGVIEICINDKNVFYWGVLVCGKVLFVEIFIGQDEKKIV